MADLAQAGALPIDLMDLEVSPVRTVRAGRQGFGGKVAGSKGECAGSWMGRPVASMSVGVTRTNRWLTWS